VGRKLTRRIAAFLGIIILFLFSYEIVLRARGLMPFVSQVYQVTYEPSFVFVPHKNLGYTLAPGKFKFTLNYLDSLAFHPQHTENFTRATHADNLPDSLRNQATIVVFGASYTYGQGVEDSMTYPWLLQEKLENYNMVNYGVPGYGPIHALLILQGLAEKGEMPSLVILAYSYYHDNTNTLPRKSRESITRFSNMNNREFIEHSSAPYCTINEEGNLVINHIRYDSFYSEWPLRQHSSVVNLLEIKYNEWELKQHESQRVSKHIIERIKALCDEKKATFLVAGITGHEDTKAVLSHCEKQGIRTVNIALDLTENQQLRIHPDDPHPNSLAHNHYARTLLRYVLKEDLVLVN